MKCPHCNKHFCKKLPSYPEFLKKIIKLHEEGYSLKNIEADLDYKVSIATINKYICAYELGASLGILNMGAL